VRCVTSPINTGSIAFHALLVFAIESQDTGADGFTAIPDDDGSEQARALRETAARSPG